MQHFVITLNVCLQGDGHLKETPENTKLIKT